MKSSTLSGLTCSLTINMYMLISVAIEMGDRRE